MNTLEEFSHAVKHGELEKVKKFLREQPGLGRQRFEGATALHFAAIRNDHMVVDLLLREGANPEAVDDEFEATPMGWANEAGHTDMVEFLYERGAHLGFIHAAAFGFTDLIRRTIQNHIYEINTMGGYGTPLHLAVLWGHPEIVKILLNHGADPNLRNVWGRTTLEIAKEQCSTNGSATPLVNAARKKEIVENCEIIVGILESWLNKT